MVQGRPIPRLDGQRQRFADELDLRPLRAFAQGDRPSRAGPGVFGMTRRGVGESPVGFIVVAKQPWTIEAGQLTPTMKIRRGAIESLYADNMEEWYGKGQKVIWE